MQHHCITALQLPVSRSTHFCCLLWSREFSNSAVESSGEWRKTCQVGKSCQSERRRERRWNGFASAVNEWNMFGCVPRWMQGAQALCTPVQSLLAAEGKEGKRWKEKETLPVQVITDLSRRAPVLRQERTFRWAALPLLSFSSFWLSRHFVSLLDIDSTFLSFCPFLRPALPLLNYNCKWVASANSE